MTSGCIVRMPSASAMRPRDPVTRTQMFLLREGILDEKGINQLEKEVEAELQAAVDQALEALAARSREHHEVCVFAGYRSHVVGV